jgi:hypothetical protein
MVLEKKAIKKSLGVLFLLLFLYFLLYRWIHSTNIIEGHSSDFEQYHDNDDPTCSNGNSCHNGTCNDDTGECDCTSDLWYGSHCDKLKSFYDFTENHTDKTDADGLWKNILTCEEKDDSYECEMEYNVGALQRRGTGPVHSDDHNIYLPPPGWNDQDRENPPTHTRADGLIGGGACYYPEKSCPERMTSATCTETATGADSDPIDAAACAAGRRHPTDLNGCYGVMTNADDSVRACTYSDNCNYTIPYDIDDPIRLGIAADHGIGRNLRGTLPSRGGQINSWDDVDLNDAFAQMKWRDDRRCRFDFDQWEFNREINYCNTPGGGQTTTYNPTTHRRDPGYGAPTRGGRQLSQVLLDPDVGSPCPDQGECTFVKADDPSAGPNRERDRIICQKPNRDDRQRDSVARLPDCPRGDGIGQWHNESVGLPNDSSETYASSTNRDGMQVEEPCKCPDGTSYQTTTDRRDSAMTRNGPPDAGRWRCA